MSPSLLAGIRVLDLSPLLPGPYATLLLADLGAEVIKVEPRIGDLARQVPPLAGHRSPFFLSLNRNKRSLGVNLRQPRGRALFLDLARHADVVVESFRPGRAAQMGIGPDDLRAVNARLVYCSISGFGQTGPDARRAGHDLTYAARGGLLDISGAAGGPPSIPALPVADLAAATHAAFGICAALVARDRTGEGQVLDVSMLESLLGWMRPILAAHQVGFAAERGRLPLAGRYPFYAVYPAADGGYIALGIIEPVFWRAFCLAAGRPDWARLQFAEGEARERLATGLAELFAGRSRAEWAAFFRAHDLPAEVVVGVDAVLADPQLAARGAWLVVEHAPGEGRREPCGPVRLGRAGSAAGDAGAAEDVETGSAGVGVEGTGVVPEPKPRPAPELGADSRAILRDVLGMAAPEIDVLVEAGVVFHIPDASLHRLAPDDIG